MKPYETATHIMRNGRLVLKPKPVTLPLNDPIRQIRKGQIISAENRNLSQAW